ncbi:MAG: AAA family ATPase [Odoribacter sp.]
MKIIAIRGKNLASLEGEFEVDFAAEPLKSAGIFAITGSTGSGKSTLLDALCLALFDDTPRTNRASENNIQIADVKDRTINQKDSRNILRRGTSDGYAEVDFISLGGEKFQSRWSVRRSRDKVDGSLQNTEFRLTNLSANLEIQGRKTELLAKVVELIGLTFEQFTRAVLLAQGDFATFLKATQKEKAELLEKLTGTDIYSRISTSIYEKAKAAEQELNLLKERIKDIELLSEEQLETLAAEKHAIQQEVESLKNELLIFTAKIKWLTDEEILNSGIQQAEHVLAASQSAIDEAKARYDYLLQMDRVQEIRDRFNEWRNAQKQIICNQENLTKQESMRKATMEHLQKVTDKLKECNALQKQHNEAFEAIEPQIRQTRELDVRMIDAHKNAQDATKEYTQAVEAKAKIEKTIVATQKAIETTGQNILKINQWLEANSSYKEIVPRMDLIINLLNDLTIATQQGAYNNKTLTASKEILDNDVYQLGEQKQEAERLNNLLPAEIATLRAKLTDNTPCPVCGSLHHPMSGVQGESLEEKKLGQAKEAVANRITTLTENIEKRKSEHIRLQSVIESYAQQSREATTKLSDFLHPLAWQELLKQGILKNTLQELAGRWNQYTAELTKAYEETAHLKTTLTLQQEYIVEITNTLISKELKQKNSLQALEQLQQSRIKLFGEQDTDKVEKTYTEKRKELSDRLTLLNNEKNELSALNEKYTGSITQISGDTTKLTMRSEVLQKEVNDWIRSKNETIPIERLTEWLSKDIHWIATEREALNKLRANKTSAQATLTERQQTREKHHQSEAKPAEGEIKETLQTALTERNSLFQQKTARNTEIDILWANHNKGKEKIKIFEKELEEKNTRSDNWKKLNDLFGSADGGKFKVLAQGYTLEALLTYANKHLQELSKRYQLKRIPDTLALQVIDLDMLGEIRSVHSLSGGESFLISLALALGLSSLSSNRMKVESLFIDEGFGSLDIDTLRVAMDALERLQTQGRKIGVISHVAEMTERITTQIRVVKTINGRSKIEIA